MKTTRGTATELRTADHVGFPFLVESLPWVVPDEALPGYQLVEAETKLSREILRISDLAPGRYQLRIDESTIGDFSHWELARGIELQGNINTPQYQQARQVAQLNKNRNEQGIAVLREQWPQLKDRRQRSRSEDTPFEPWFASFPEKVSELHKLIAGYVERIYLANQPIPCKHEIIKMPHPGKLNPSQSSSLPGKRQ